MAKRIELMFEVIEEWESSTRNAPPRPEPNSSLAADDAAFPKMPPSVVGYDGLLTATEHLAFFKDAFIATGRTYPSAYYPGLRTALIGAALACWVLVPSARTVRIEHALKIVLDDNRNRRTLAAEIPGLSAEQKQEMDRHVNALKTQAGELAVAAEAVGVTIPKLDKFSLITKQVIADAADLVFNHGDPDFKTVRLGARVLWRTQSGHAHGSLSSRLGLTTGKIVRNSDGSAWGMATADVEDIVAAAAAAVMLANKAWRTFRSRLRP